jgi:hypothetical protein
MIGSKYTVKSGDCLWKIAREALGSGKQWPRIWRYNNRREVVRVTGRGIPNPDLIYPGQVLLIPSLPNAPGKPVPGGPVSPTKPVGQTDRSGQKEKAGSTANRAPPATRGPLSTELPDVQSPISMKFRLDEMKFPPMYQPGMIMEVQMSGDIILMSKKRYPAIYITQRRELEMQAVQQANDAFRSLLNDTRLIYDSRENKLTYRSMLVAKSGQPDSWATAIGVQVDSSNPLPKLRFEFRAPNPLSGVLSQHIYTAVDVKIVIELTPKPDVRANPDPRRERAPQPASVSQSATNWGGVIGAGLVIVAGAIVVGTLVEDFFTAGAGIADDPISFGAASGFAVRGWAMIRAGASALPVATIPAMASVTFELATTGSPKGEMLRR